ncbi:MAG: hypothetical protein PWP31_100 [Clostridia bacterium]|nr:hypothetical protein [Clostridia bacterium]
MADQEMNIVLTDEEGHEHEFTVVDVLSLEENDYAILIPAEEEKFNGEAIVLRVELDENRQEVLAEIEDEEEWQRVVKAWEEAIDEELEDEEE